nr:hypothetical protein [Tanacetum cinerariifolium]
NIKGKWRYLISAIPPIHNHVLIPNYQDFKIQDFCYSDEFECFQAINIGSQDKYVAEILRKFRLSKGKSASTPIVAEKPLLKDSDGEDVDVHTYRYLKRKPFLGLWYPKDSPFDLVAYSDSDYAGASLDRKSTTRGCQFLGCKLISWQCKKQIMVATSSTKAKYVAAASGCAQVLWMQNQLLDYGYNFMHTHDLYLSLCDHHHLVLLVILDLHAHTFLVEYDRVAEVLIVGYEHVVMNCGSAGNRYLHSPLMFPAIKQLTIKWWDEYGFVIHLGGGYSQKDKNKAKTRQNRARDWKEHGKPKPKAYVS